MHTISSGPMGVIYEVKVAAISCKAVINHFLSKLYTFHDMICFYIIIISDKWRINNSLMKSMRHFKRWNCYFGCLKAHSFIHRRRDRLWFGQSTQPVAALPPNSPTPPPSADVVNSITTPSMNKYAWHGDIWDKFASTWEDTFKPEAPGRLTGCPAVCETANDF